MKILHISDTHFHHLDEDNAPLLQRIEALKAYPDHIILLTGDVTDDGRDDQRQKALDALKILSGRVFVLPGNHDYGAVGTIYNSADAKAFDDLAIEFNGGSFFDKTPDIIEIENVLFILLNSCLETESPFDFACGEVGGHQRGQLAKILDDPANKSFIKIVSLHHHPFIHSDPTMELLDADIFMRSIYGKVDILTFGHRHVEGYWHKKSGCQEILAAGALFESDHVKEITIEGDQISVKQVKLF